MNLLSGVLFLCLSAVLFGIGMLFFRNPRLPKWADGFVFVSTAVIVIIGLGSTGLVLITFAVDDLKAVGWLHLLLTAAMLVASALILWLLHIPKKLKEYSKQEAFVLAFKAFEDEYGSEKGPTPSQGNLAA